MNQVQTEVIFLNLLRQADEFIFSILGMNPTPDSGSFRARVSALFDMFKADKYNFVLSPVHLGFLATLIKEYGAFRKSEITQIGTPEILIGQIRWEDIYDKPDILAASADWADITNKPATFPPTTHAHDYASITDKPATFAPSAHAHDFASITDKPATFAPDTHSHVKSDVTDFAHSHAYADVTSKPTTFDANFSYVEFTGNGAATRNIAFTPSDRIARAVIGRSTNSARQCFLTAFANNHVSFSTPGVLSIVTANWNESGVPYAFIILF